MQSTASFNRCRTALAVGALARAGDRAFSRVGCSGTLTKEYLDAVPEADIARGLGLLLQQQGGMQSRASRPGVKTLWFGEVVNGVPRWLLNLQTPRQPSPVERQALRNDRICKAVAGGTLLSEAIETTLADEARRDEIRRLTDPAPTNRTTDDDIQVRDAFEAHDARQTLRQEIAEHERWLADSRAGRHTAPSGPSIAVALRKPYGCNRQKENPKLYETCLHEAGHFAVLWDYGLQAEHVVAHRDGNGCCTMTDESVRRATPAQRAAIFAAGTQAAYEAGAVNNTKLQDHKPECDGPRFDEAVGGDSEGDEAVTATRHARFVIQSNAAGIHALARVLHDHAGVEIPGTSCAAIFAFHRGDLDEELDEAATEAALRGEEWPWARGTPRGLR